jgi:hypothetical protein
MEDIHTPTVVSGRRAVNGIHGTQPTTLAELSAEKERLEGQLRALSGVLDSVRRYLHTSTFSQGRAMANPSTARHEHER